LQNTMQHVVDGTNDENLQIKKNTKDAFL
jgi:hypothetical protein